MEAGYTNSSVNYIQVPLAVYAKLFPKKTQDLIEMIPGFYEALFDTSYVARFRVSGDPESEQLEQLEIGHLEDEWQMLK